MAQTLKTQTISEITQDTTTALTGMEMTQSPAFGGGKPTTGFTSSEFSAYQTWMVQGAGEASKINAYFPGNNLPTHWNNLYGLVKNLYIFSYTTDSNRRQTALSSMQKYFTFHKVTGIDWNSLSSGDPSHGSYRQAWIGLERAILRVRDSINADIMGASEPVF